MLSLTMAMVSRIFSNMGIGMKRLPTSSMMPLRVGVSVGVRDEEGGKKEILYVRER
jgi:hypothetical protein